MKSVVRPLSELGVEMVLAPERWLAAADAGTGVPLADLVDERRERAEPSALILDTTHARDGVLDLAAAERTPAEAKSAKKATVAGDLVVSRLRPYLRQIALVHEAALEGRSLGLSTEFYVLAPRTKGESLAFLLPFLLGPHAQAVLAAAQEGGHHPRVPRSSLFALRVPEALVRERRRRSREVESALAEVYRAGQRYQRLLRASVRDEGVSERRRGKRDRSP